MKFCLFTVAAADNVLLSDVKVCDDVKSVICNNDFMLYTARSLLFFTHYSTNSSEMPAWSFSTSRVMSVTQLCHSLSLYVFYYYYFYHL